MFRSNLRAFSSAAGRTSKSNYIKYLWHIKINSKYLRVSEKSKKLFDAIDWYAIGKIEKKSDDWFFK